MISSQQPYLGLMRAAASTPSNNPAHPRGHAGSCCDLMSNTILPAAHVVPPVPEPPESDLGILQVLRALKANATQIWPKHAYREPITRRPFLGKTTFVLNDSDPVS